MNLGAGHHHNHGIDRLNLAVFINVILTIVQIVGGVLSGSLALVADAVHNLSDAGAIFIAILARKVGGKEANNKFSYGYKRAEILGSLINSTSLILIGIYLSYEAATRAFNPQPIDGWIVVWVAGIALAIDIGTAWLTYTAGSKDNMNIRAAFIHNVSDALASVAVIISGTLVILFDVYFVDVVATIGISLYVIVHGILLVKEAVRILMQAVPTGYDIEKIRNKITAIDNIANADHLHLWQLDDKRIFFEGQVAVSTRNCDCNSTLSSIKTMLKRDFKIDHVTIELI